MDQFDAYFRRADLDGDGRISGAEAVNFFQGSNLPKPVLAQIWTYADQARTGFLDRPQFYNALKLVTVAQSKRDLTPDIVKAALYSPAAAKIPPPQINLAAIPAPQLNSMAGPAASHAGAVPPTASQHYGVRGSSVPNSIMNQPSFPAQQNPSVRPGQPMPAQNPSMRPVQPMPAVTSLHPPAQRITTPEIGRGGGMVGPGAPNSTISTDWFSGGKTAGGGSGPPAGGISPAPNRGNSPSLPSFNSRPQDLGLASTLPAAKDSKALVMSDPSFGADSFSTTPTLPRQASNASTYTSGSAPHSSALVPVTTGSHSSPKTTAIDPMQYFNVHPSGSQIQHPQTIIPNQRAPAPNISSSSYSGMSVGAGHSASNQSQALSWPKMKSTDVQKYTKVFVEVDTDRDGKITGKQALDLFLSWRLPREVLKQVWDLSDQDNDGMLSLREFCIALYLMERFREGQSLPSALPPNILLDESLSVTAQTPAVYGNPSWGPNPGLRPHQGTPGPRPGTHVSGLRPPLPTMTHQPEKSIQPNMPKTRTGVVNDPFGNTIRNREQNSRGGDPQEAVEAEKKVKEGEKVYLDSREKIEYYRTMMQELVLYKSRCDNRLNEITERALADKREAESLGKKYEEKYKLVGELSSKLTIEEARFRDIQERKTELEQAIVKMEQGGSADGILQVRADRIQSDLDTLMKALTERCKKLGLTINSTALFEFPKGWQPGPQEEAADWDEDWDKFEDEGFYHDVQNGVASSKPQSESGHARKGSSNDSIISDGKSERPLFTDDHVPEYDSMYARSEDEFGRSSPPSPAAMSELTSHSQEFSENHFRKSIDGDADFHNGSFDESGWGTFDNNDDVDSVWGFNPSNNKDEKHGENYYFDSGRMGLDPVRTESPQSESGFQSKSPFVFADSVPSTPASKYGNSPRGFNTHGTVDNFFDSSSRFDSFSIPDTNSPRRETHTRFDSMSSTSDFGGLNRFTSFDDADPFGSTGPFKVSSESQTPKRDSGNWNAF